MEIYGRFSDLLKSFWIYCDSSRMDMLYGAICVLDTICYVVKDYIN